MRWATLSGSIPGAGHLFRYVTNQPPKANLAFHPSGVDKWVPASAGKAKAGMVHFIGGWTWGVQVKLWDPLRTRAIPEHLSGVFTTRRYINPRLPLLLLNRFCMATAYRCCNYWSARRRCTSIGFAIPGVRRFLSGEISTSVKTNKWSVFAVSSVDSEQFRRDLKTSLADIRSVSVFGCVSYVIALLQIDIYLLTYLHSTSRRGLFVQHEGHQDSQAECWRRQLGPVQ